MGFWQNVDNEREYKCISRKELSKAAGFSLNCISTGIVRNSIPAADLALRIARVLNVSVEKLLGEKDSHSEPVEFSESKKITPMATFLHGAKNPEPPQSEVEYVNFTCSDEEFFQNGGPTTNAAEYIDDGESIGTIPQCEEITQEQLKLIKKYEKLLEELETLSETERKPIEEMIHNMANLAKHGKK